ncbi:anti-sigma F factor [Ammoniphilus resinae]|uniref:Anti-sigma F factor n=1 Tax=Ammoniphilus resinae TaxID=861532 RepID=A0ABS4GTC8_9BACL|nr:anti-sigma F factor [Ammoniphilus resinae]MBP1933527.1 stage II sporulation protein AB (anti-sigma F factor) [Ammoniphilus resinae]
MMNNKNFMQLQFSARSENESFARVAVASFVSKLDLTLDELEEIKTAVSEAVTNSIIHGYDEDPEQIVIVTAGYTDESIEIMIEDHGKGIVDIEEARQPLFTTKPELERSGMGFTIMENFMDSIEILTGVNKGTKVILHKNLVKNKAICN